ncbi:type II secretion system protein GspC [Thalassotalea sp. HSM 43]|uniref:type II secretion system protein GspC n=1 Tax=Thalassotalea sp. HSM 43 TaxID=2552945 RepID=UPI001080FC9D|nr:type II secretion system protein GspC [Thalassotalea sp. HSM 43]QBY04634.1 type II secretion system protein GspC [Thalassotalea sp. HSM 43]
MDLAHITIQLQSLWQKVPQQALTRALITLLVIYIAFWAANFTWMLVPQAEKATSGVPISQTIAGKSSSKNLDISSITKLNLFGEYNKQVEVETPVETIESAPETKLRLTLTGVVASDDQTTAAAIVESKGVQETYGIDDKITGTRAILKQVHNDRVIIQSSGRMETLMLDGFEYTKEFRADQPAADEVKIKTTVKSTKKNNPGVNKDDSERQARIKERVAQARSEILDNPGKLTDYIKISPYRVEGKVAGYRLMPSKNPEFFQEVGLQPGDVAVQINGRDLTDMREAQKALAELRKSEHVDLLVERDGVLHDISLGLDN